MGILGLKAIKLLVASETDQILGLTVFGADTSEILAVVQTAMVGGLPYPTLRDAIFTHSPSEGLTVLPANVPAKQARKAA
jgi:pyruvate/2-oxoglutarate dehydrogenase complex dihydrolipoamide dehydrogenase (E3) component